MQPKNPKIAQALKQLSVFVGAWKGDGTFLEGAGPGAGMSIQENETYVWLPGDFFMANDSAVVFEGGFLKAHRVFGYDEQKDAYTMQAYDSMGFARTYTGGVEGVEWRFTGEFERVTLTFGENNSRLTTFWENTIDGKMWLPLCKTEQTKQ